MFDIEELEFLTETYCFLLLSPIVSYFHMRHIVSYKPALHDTSDPIMLELAHQYVMINSVECFS